MLLDSPADLYREVRRKTDVLPQQPAASPEAECFDVCMIERDSWRVVGDIGFIGPLDGRG